MGKRTEKYRSLEWVVECKMPPIGPTHATWFEPICAFNVREVARTYAANCRKGNPAFEYRVVRYDATAKEWRVVG